MTSNPIIIKAPESVTARREMRTRLSGPVASISNKWLLGKDMDSQEYLLGELVGLSDMHIQAFPEVWERLQRAEKLDWNKALIAPADNAKRFETRNFGSFEGLYRELVEPWLGKYEDLKETYERYERGEIDHDHAATEIKKSRAERAAEKAEQIRQTRADNPDWTQAQIAEHVGVSQKHISEVLNIPESATVAASGITRSQRAQAEGVTTEHLRQRDYVAKHAPELAERIGKDLSVSAAYRQVRPPDAYKQLCKFWRAASEEQRAEFESYIAEWRTRNAS